MMAKMLVTGGLSRQCNPAKNKRDVMVSWMLAEALRDMGHEVEHRNPEITEDYADFDMVFIGMSALHSLGCNRSYGMLAAYLRTFSEGRCTLYVDDADCAKFMSGLRVMKNDPTKLTKPFYKYRKEYDVAADPAMHEWLMQGVNFLHDYAWPTTIIPMFPWGDVNAIRNKIPNITNPVLVDFTSYVPEYVGPDEWAAERDQVWVTECRIDDRWLGQQRPVFPVRYYSKGQLKRPEDAPLVLDYAKSWGVLDPGLDNGFFYSRLVYAAQARSLYVTKWQNVQPLGDSYALLADAAAGLDQESRIAWVEAQAASLDNLTWKRDQVKDTLSSITKESVSV